MKVIFLDIDGVLNTDFESFDAVLVARLVQVLKRTNARIVLSSSWRTSVTDVLGDRWWNHHLDPLWASFLVELNEAGLPRAVTNRFLGPTPDMLWGQEDPWIQPKGLRGQEILRWLSAEHFGKVKSWVALDDTADWIVGPSFPSARFVQTASAHGLQDEHVERLVAILNASA